MSDLARVLDCARGTVLTRLRRLEERRVIVGWDGFDAAKAVQEARGEYLDRLANPKSR